MSACFEVGQWITENIVTPVEEFIEEAVERCEDARRWVEREVRRPVERERTRQEKKCKRRACNWWCACCNKWLCWFVTIVYRVVEYVTEVVGEWLVETVCKIVMQVVKIIVDVVTAVLRFVVTGVVCLVTGEWRGALDSLIDFWFDLLDVVDSVGRLFEIVFEAIEDFLDITARFVRDLGEWFGPAGRVIFGAIAGMIDAARQLVAGARAIVSGAIRAVTALGRLDFCGFAAELSWGVTNGLGRVVPGVLGGATFGARGVRDAFSDQKARDRARAAIEQGLRDEAMAAGVDVVDEEAIARAVDVIADSADLDSRTWGVPWRIDPRRLSIPSMSDVLNLAEMHRSQRIDLYAIAGYAPVWQTGCFGGRRWRVVYEGTDRRVRLAELRSYLERGRNEAPAFEMVPIPLHALRRDLATAKRKFRRVGVHLDIGRITSMPVRATPDPLFGDEFEFIAGYFRDGGSTEWRANLTRLFERHGYATDPCFMPMVAMFQYESGQFGQASIWWPWQTQPPVPTDPAELSDLIVSDGERAFAQRQPKPVGGSYRDSRPEVVMGYVLAHELGHAFGLEHEGHDSVHYIMFRAGQSNATGETGRMLAEFLLLGGEPIFSLDDVERVWLWITRVGAQCLPEPQLEENQDALAADLRLRLRDPGPR